MTRINVIDPKDLTDQHLMAEYRELPRIYKLANDAYNRGLPAIPPRYALGKGHVLFFYNKITFLINRHNALIIEMHNRNYKTNFLAPPVSDFPSELTKTIWVPDTEEILINLARLLEREPYHEPYRTLKNIDF